MALQDVVLNPFVLDLHLRVTVPAEELGSVALPQLVGGAIGQAAIAALDGAGLHSAEIALAGELTAGSSLRMVPDPAPVGDGSGAGEGDGSGGTDA